MQEPKFPIENLPLDQKPILDVQFPDFGNLIRKVRGPQGSELPSFDQKEASVLTAVSPGYAYHFATGSLKLETTLTESKVNALLSKNFGRSALLLGYGSTWTHFLIALAVSNTKVKVEELYPFGMIELTAKEMAQAAEAELQKNLLSQIQKNGKPLRNLMTSTEQESPPVILSSELKEAQKYYNKMIQVYDGIKVEGIEDKNNEFKHYINLCIKPAINRLYQKDLLIPFSQSKVFCKIKNKRNEEYNLLDLVKRMMVIHLIEEMSHFLYCIDEYKVHYILHEGTNKANGTHDRLIKLIVPMFLPDRIGLGNLQNIRFTPKFTLKKTIKPNKGLALESTPTLTPIIPTQNLPSVPAPIQETKHHVKPLSPKYDEDVAHSLSFDSEPIKSEMEKELSNRTEMLHMYIVHPLIKRILPMITSFTQEREWRELLLASVGKEDLYDLRVEVLNQLYRESYLVKIVLDLIVDTLSLNIKHFIHVMIDITRYIDALKAKNISDSEMKSVLSSDKGPKPHSHKLQQTSQDGIRHSDNMHLTMTKLKRSKSVSDLPNLETLHL